MRREDQKSVTVGSKSYDAMWAEVAARNAVVAPPADGISAPDYAARFGVSLKAAELVLRKEAARSEILRIHHKGCVRNVRYYFLK